MLACAAVGVQAVSLQLDVDRAEKSAHAGPSSHRAAAPAADAGGRVEDRDDADQRRAARRLADDLRYPWTAALATLEASTPEGVRWLSFDLASEGGELRLEGAAPAAGAALRVVDSFAARPGWRDVALLRLQREGRDAGTTPLRFSVAAKLDPVLLLRAADPSSP